MEISTHANFSECIKILPIELFASAGKNITNFHKFWSIFHDSCVMLASYFLSFTSFKSFSIY